MEFCYYWIDKYNDFIEDQGFNFGGEFLFEYRLGEKKLIIKKNENYIENFFNTNKQGKISNITAIVGRNGVGKSTIIEALKGLLLDGGILGKRDKTEEGSYYFYKRILVIKLENKYRIIFHKDLLELDIQGNYNIVYDGIEDQDFKLLFSLTSYGTTKNTHPCKRNKLIRVDDTKILHSTVCVHFSNVFDSNEYYYYSMPKEKYFDISNMGLLNNIYKNPNEFRNQKIEKGNAYHLEQKDLRFGTSILDDFSAGELEAKILALQDEQSKKEIRKFMSLPEKLVLNLDYISYKAENFSFLDYDESNLLRCEIKQSELNKVEQIIYKKIRELSSDGSEKSLAKRTLYFRIIDAYFNDVETFIRFKARKENIKAKLEELDTNSITKLDIVNMLNVFLDTVVGMNEKEELDLENDFSNFNKFNKKEFLKLHKGYIGLIEFFEKNIESDRITFQKGTINSTTIDDNGIRASGISDIAIIEVLLDDEGLQLANEFINIYRKLYTLADFMKFSWKGISSGEDALFSMLSRFHSLREHLVGESIVIFLDEGELCLHPEWQRKYIDIITSYIQRVFSSAKNIQIIFSSNSPLLISDLPNHNIIFLDRFKEGERYGKCRVVENSEFPQTFGANIHNLMINGFFMESTMGEFSIKKTNEVISFLKEGVPESLESAVGSMMKAEEIDAIINLLGEPIMRRKLNHMFQSKKEKLQKIISGNIDDIDTIKDIHALKEISSIIEKQIAVLENKDNEND
ncbi:AAA family ATPase [Priestia megaterium]|mgnify:CR=1 FL=1|uniref:AAA family ATPase n=1 Tax=Priestia megaterium TaxID=1404 RepID=UPI00186794F3|nr:AAA family ATPase [Priestia megaterium]MBE2975810.1 AAA family ATPase [Priestia megaterium]